MMMPAAPRSGDARELKRRRLSSEERRGAHAEIEQGERDQQDEDQPPKPAAIAQNGRLAIVVIHGAISGVGSMSGSRSRRAFHGS